MRSIFLSGKSLLFGTTKRVQVDRICILLKLYMGVYTEMGRKGAGHDAQILTQLQVMTSEEIAHVTGLHPASVNRLTRRAISKLREHPVMYLNFLELVVYEGIHRSNNLGTMYRDEVI